MTGRQFFNAVANGREDALQIFLDLLASARVDYCVVGGLAVNAYVEPVVSLDLDMVVAAKDIDRVCKASELHFRVQRFEHSVNLSTKKSDLRIQLQTDPRYQDFIAPAKMRKVLGYRMKVAGIEDVLQGKVWAYLDPQRRKSKRQKDLADILRLVETHPRLTASLPAEIKKAVE